MNLRSLLLMTMCVNVPAGRALASEGEAGPTWRLGVMAGWHATADDYDVLGERRAGLVPGGGPLFGLRTALELDPMFAIEVELGMVAAPAGDDGTAWIMPVRASMGWRALPDAIVTPLLTLGAGLVANVAGPGSGDADLLLGATAGAELRVGEVGALRLEGGVLASDAVSGALSWSPIATLGFDFFLGGGRAREPRTPTTTTSPAMTPLGCPRGVPIMLCNDADGDRRIDAFDLCPADASKRPDGCPDPDGDGVLGTDDACPAARGQALDWGCPR